MLLTISLLMLTSLSEAAVHSRETPINVSPALETEQNVTQTGGVSANPYPRQEGPNYAGREFIFTFGDNRPKPTSYMMLVPYNTEQVVRCTVTYYLGKDKLPQTFEYDVPKEGKMIKPPREIVIIVVDNNLPEFVDQKSIHITAEREIAVYAFSNALFSTDAFMALPTDVLGVKYVIPSSDHQHTTLRATAMIIVTGTCDGVTNVLYKFPSSTVGFYHPVHGTWQQGAGLNVSIQKYETIMLQADSDLTGTTISTDCAVAVMSGNKRGVIDGATGDHMIEMIPPISRFGRKFITTPLVKRTTGEVYKLIGGRKGMTCELKFKTPSQEKIRAKSLNISLDEGGVYIFNASSNEYVIVECSDSAILVQYAKSAGSVKYGDPFMTLIPGVVQYDSSYTVACMQISGGYGGPFDHFISVTVPTDHVSGLKVDGVYISPNDTLFLDLDKISVIHNTTIPGTDYTHIVMEVSKGVHTLVHENPTVTFGVMVYGLKKSESYGYPGGLRLAPSGADCVKNITDAINDNINSDCDWLVDEELADGIDNDLDGLIDEDIAANILYPVQEMPQIEAEMNKALKSSDIPVEDEEGFPWSVFLVSLLSSIVLLALVTALLMYFKRTKPQLPAGPGPLPTEFDNRLSPSRISIRAVWKKTNPTRRRSINTVASSSTS